MQRRGINGFGWSGRLVVRGLRHYEQLEIVPLNDPAADAETGADSFRMADLAAKVADGL